MDRNISGSGNTTSAAGTRIFYWNIAGQMVFGTVQRMMRGADGTPVLEVKLDATGGLITLAAASVSRV
ncbi:hypothetical protein B0H11DRAFT_447537 [Mycena galericulata]|nr:hypothetical protein B0H11DRAFT_447537 [Mycena galericulata]